MDPRTAYLVQKSDEIQSYYDGLGADRDRWIRRNQYYYDQLLDLLRLFVPQGREILDVGCGTGDLLAGMRPSRGVGLDISPQMVRVASQKFPALRFVAGAAEADPLGDEQFDYISMVNVVGEMTDVLKALHQARRHCRPQTRLIIVFYNYLWEPACRVAATVGMKLDNPTQNWLGVQDLSKFLHLADFDVIRTGYRVLMPLRIPLAPLINQVLAKLPLFNRLGFVTYVVARPLSPPTDPAQVTCSVIVPCKDEQDNVRHVVERIPRMGRQTEIVFVDDRSQDATVERVHQQIAAHPDRPIKLARGPGQGKGPACRAGFDAATGDVLMILDADMTVMPEDLPSFFEAMCRGKGEFINGSRMVYPLARDSMRTLNVLGNKGFATVFSFLLEQPIKDTLCGTKAFFRRDWPDLRAARDYFGGIDRWGDFELLFGASRRSLKIVELPVHYLPRVAGETKMNRRIRNGLIMLRMCWVALRKLKLQ